MLAASAAEALEFHAALVVAPQAITEDRSSPYYVGPPTVETARRSSRNEAELRVQEGGFNAQGILRQQVANGQRPEYHGIANQFYYDGQITPGLGWTVGKKLMPWGVGFGFKPLDVIQREDRRGINPPPLVGVPLIALERLTETDAWTIAWTRPGQGGGETDSRDSSLALHWYRLADGDDLHGVLRVSQRRRLEAGLGATRVIGEEWSIHGAALYQRRGWQRTNALLDNGGTFASADPMTEQTRGSGAKSVAGVQWTGESGLSVLVEAWYDADAYRHRDWQALDALTARQRALAGFAPAAAIDGNVAWSSQAFLATNLLRENLLLRLAWDDRDGFKPYLDVLFTPSDGGRVYTVGASWQGNRNRLTLGLRQVGGRADSAYAQAPIKRVIWAEWRWAIF
ncbi:MAG: hypothetical protein HZC22_06440 [Rhodocyclales bacterium]|nr:hypothetical protein [Rhodocyclales bacterium]